MRRFLKRLLLFVLIVVGLQIIVGYKVPDRIRLLDKAMSEGELDIIFFCDSTNFVCGTEDTDKRSISQMLQNVMPERRVLTIDHGAYQMDVYFAFCRYIARGKRRPDAVIIPINMRTFSPGWDLRPGWQFERERFFLACRLARPFFKPLGVFKALSTNDITMEQYYNTGVYYDNELVGTVQNFDLICQDPNNVTNEDIRRQFIFEYMYPLGSDHRKLQSMLEIIEVLRSVGVKCVFYITPIDVEAGEKYLPGKFCCTLRANVDLVNALLRNQGIKPLDLSQSIPATHFSWRIYPNEHLDQHARFFVADCLSKALRDSKPIEMTQGCE